MKVSNISRLLAATVFVIVFGVAGAATAQTVSGGALPAAPSATTAAELTAEEVADLQYTREEEKLARDVYNVLYQRWNLRVFANIAKSEQTHTDAVKTLIERYGIEDPAASTAPGVFVNEDLQTLYTILVYQGLESRTAAIDVGVLIEETDITDLGEAMSRTAKADILQVYSNLLAGSYSHLAAFSR